MSFQDKPPIGKGKINTFADGSDVGRVNLWSSTNGRTRKEVCSLKNGEPVNILEEGETYILVEAVIKKSCRGYCMKEFVTKSKK